MVATIAVIYIVSNLMSCFTDSKVILTFESSHFYRSWVLLYYLILKRGFFY